MPKLVFHILHLCVTSEQQSAPVVYRIISYFAPVYCFRTTTCITYCCKNNILQLLCKHRSAFALHARFTMKCIHKTISMLHFICGLTQHWQGNLITFLIVFSMLHVHLYFSIYYLNSSTLAFSRLCDILLAECCHLLADLFARLHTSYCCFRRQLKIINFSLSQLCNTWSINAVTSRVCRMHLVPCRIHTLFLAHRLHFQ